MTPFESIDQSLRALEKLMHISITLIDNHGIFRNQNEQALFSNHRQSHKKNAVCKLGFCNKRCIGHCRFEMMAVAESCPSDFFIHECWKGLTEVVVPLKQDHALFGILYAGIWRIQGQTQPNEKDSLPKSATQAYARLDEFDQTRANRIGRALTLVSKGIVDSLETLICHHRSHENRTNIIKRFVFRHANTNASLTDLSHELGLSVSRSSHVVKELFGKSFEELLIAERISRARYLLQTTDLLIGKIAQITGFPDAFSFSKIFKRHLKLTPSQFRKMA